MVKAPICRGESVGLLRHRVEGRCLPFWTLRTPALRSYKVRLLTWLLRLSKSIARRLVGVKLGAHDKSEKRGETESRREQLKVEDRERLAGENQVPAGHPRPPSGPNTSRGTTPDATATEANLQIHFYSYFQVNIIICHSVGTYTHKYMFRSNHHGEGNRVGSRTAPTL